MTRKEIDLFGNDVTGKGLSTGKKPVFIQTTSKKTTSKKKTPTYSGNVTVDPSYYATSGSGGSYSGSGTRWYNVEKRDISGLLQAYENEAATQRKIANDTYDTTRNDLLTQLKRYQESNAKDVQNQKQNYLTEQSNLESARESANRQSRISSAARGLGGSGLQQLAQLQNMMSQSADVSKAASENQSAMDALAKALREYTEDNESKQRDALTARDNALATIASTLRSQIEQARGDAEREYTNAKNARNAAVAQYSYSSSPGAEGSNGVADAQSAALLANQQIKNISDILNATQGMSLGKLKKYTASSKAFGKTKQKSVKDAYNALKSYTTNDIVNTLYNANVDANTINQTTKTINSLLDKWYKNNKNAKKGTPWG